MFLKCTQISAKDIKMEAAHVPEKYTNIYQNTRRHDPEGIDLTSQTINSKSQLPL